MFFCSQEKLRVLVTNASTEYYAAARRNCRRHTRNDGEQRYERQARASSLLRRDTPTAF